MVTGQQITSLSQPKLHLKHFDHGPVSRKSRQRFGPEKTFCESAIRLLWKAGVLSCLQDSKKQEKRVAGMVNRFNDLVNSNPKA